MSANGQRSENLFFSVTAARNTKKKLKSTIGGSRNERPVLPSLNSVVCAITLFTNMSGESERKEERGT